MKTSLGRPAIRSPEPDVQPQRHLPDAGVVPAQRRGGPPRRHLQRALQALRPPAEQPVPAVRGGAALPAAARGAGARRRDRGGLLRARQLHLRGGVVQRRVADEHHPTAGGHHHRQHRPGR